MALHNTQCPHCFTTYVISDDQLRVSEGMVRCGTCRERFQAHILKAEAETPRFDPRQAFIEPITEEFNEQRQAATKALAEAEPQEFSFGDIHTESIKSTTLSEATLSGSLNSNMSLEIYENAPVTPVDSKQLLAIEMLANIRAKQSRNKTAANAVSKKSGQQQLALPTKTSQSSIESNSHLEKSENSTSPRAQANNKETLIDQVDSLVDNKLIKASGANAKTKAVSQNKTKTADTPFQLDRKVKTRPLSWLLVPPLIVILVALSAALAYQLWMKQILVLKSNSFAEKKVVELSLPVTKKLAQYDIVLPVRRNLSKLELAAARTEAHPTRASTTLLRISIINHAEIEQPLPWLEMSLTDSEGRLVSRRNLSPDDYLYQNATNNLIGARELKKVTIELLSFPKQATGYQVKMLNK
ncbi:MAG: putative Zn finger-like uncharacterized protein [Arenicella sp.]|jgi:predicted Zn finger-like uncharacterized protein